MSWREGITFVWSQVIFFLKQFFSSGGLPTAVKMSVRASGKEIRQTNKYTTNVIHKQTAESRSAK